MSKKVTMSKITKLPDGSGFFTAAFPLPKNHWLYRAPAGGYDPPPAPFVMGDGEIVLNRTREMWADDIRKAAMYAIRGATERGKVMDFDPDAMVQNFVVGMIGYFTPDGLTGDAWANDPGAVKKVKAKRHSSTLIQ